MTSKIYKHLLVFLMFLAGFVPQAKSNGWEANYGGVMLQGFYWDSFEDTKWTNLTSQVNELSSYFDLIWIPNSASSGYTSMGYMPQYWFKHDSSFGSSAELREMINAYKQKGTGFIADVIINHRNGVHGWYDFPEETDHHGNKWKLGLDAICANDELAYSGQGTPTGAYDEGDNFDGARDLDHTNSYVQSAVKAYLDYLLNELGYVGFRYDMSKGYAAYYTGLYNDAVRPKYSVGEYFDGNYDLVTGWIDGTIRNNEIQSAAFDFPLKFVMNEAFAAYASNFAKLAWMREGVGNQPAGLIHMDGFRRFAVTFIDNHDTYRDNNKFSNDYYVPAANAFILCSPGTPCIFMRHWQNHKEAIKRLIDIRKSVGVHNQSNVEVWEATESVYAAKVYGKNGDLFIKVGYGDYSPYGYSNADIVATGDGYCVWTKTSISSGDDKVSASNDEKGISVYLKKSSVPASWSNIYYYAWTGSSNYITKQWPGSKVERIVTVGNEEYYKYSFDSSVSSLNVVFSNGNGSQSVDVTSITNNSYYSIASAGSDGKYKVTKETPQNDVEIAEPISVYLKKSSASAWSKVNLYAWDKNGKILNGSWPGTAMNSTIIVENEEFYAYTFDSSVTSVNIIFNDGTNQTEDITNVVTPTFYTLNSTSGKKITVKVLDYDISTGISSVEADKPIVKVADGKICATSAASIAVYNINGTMVAGEQTSCLDIAHLTPGMYFYVASNNNGTQTTGKFIK